MAKLQEFPVQEVTAAVFSRFFLFFFTAWCPMTFLPIISILFVCLFIAKWLTCMPGRLY